MRNPVLILLILVPSLLGAGSLAAKPIQVVDDAGRTLEREAPAKRIISLAPHLTEMVYAIGAEEQLIAVERSSNYPSAVDKLPRVGDVYQLDWEQVIGLKPDLILAWQSGLSAPAQQRLEGLDYQIYLSEPTSIAAIYQNLHELGQLLGREQEVAALVSELSAGFAQLQQQYLNRPQVSVYYEVWPKPPMTIAGDHLVNELLALCGGKNVYSELTGLAKTITLESLVDRQPHVIVSSALASVAQEQPDWRVAWQRRAPWLRAVKQQQLYLLPADIVQRNGPRLLQGASALCETIDRARNGVSSSAGSEGKID